MKHRLAQALVLLLALALAATCALAEPVEKGNAAELPAVELPEGALPAEEDDAVESAAMEDDADDVEIVAMEDDPDDAWEPVSLEDDGAQGIEMASRVLDSAPEAEELMLLEALDLPEPGGESDGGETNGSDEGSVGGGTAGSDGQSDGGESGGETGDPGEKADGDTGSDSDGESGDGEAEDPGAGSDGGAAPAQGGSAAPADGLKEKRFSRTVKVKNAEWENLDLVRRKGYRGKLAKVTGTLVLNNVYIEGKPAQQVNLAKYFSFAHAGRIRISGLGPLRLSACALCLDRGKRGILFLRGQDGFPIVSTHARWTSSNRRVATVDPLGRVDAKRRGSALITAEYKGGKAVCRVVVNTPVKSVRVNRRSVTVSLNHKVKLKAVLKPSNASDKAVTWRSSNRKVATVNARGVVTAKRKGTATITVRTANGKRASCRVQVNVVPLKSLAFRGSSSPCAPGRSSRRGCGGSRATPPTGSYTGPATGRSPR